MSDDRSLASESPLHAAERARQKLRDLESRSKPERESDERIDGVDVQELLVGMQRVLDTELRLRDRRIDDLLRAKQAADAASQAVASLLATTSHEIRNPLNTIIGFTELLGETPLTAEQRGLVDGTKRCSQRLLRLVSDLLDLAKANAGQMQLESIEFDLIELVQDAVGDASARCPTADVEVSCRVAPGVPMYVAGDPTRLRQILDNLLDNACKFTNRGTVVLEVQPEPAASDTTKLCFAVRDTGPGIPAQLLHTVFDAYVQNGAATARRFGGTGLGLTIAKRLVEQMGSTIRVESELGRGSTFRFSLELAVAAHDEPALAARLAGVPVLLIDSNAAERGALVELVSGWGAQVSQIDDGARALHELRAGDHSRAILVLAAHMPGVNGFKIVDALRNDRATLRRTVFLMPMRHRSGDVERLRTLGIGACLLTPIKRSDLLTALLRIGHTADAAEAVASH